MNRQEEFQKNMDYEFKEKKLLEQALTHSSYANEKHRKRMDNERLEFLGDAVLELVSSEFIYLNYPQLSEGDMTKFRASLVCEPSLADCAASLRLGEFIHLGRGEDMTGGRARKSILSDALEAVIGAIYLDGGFTSAKEFILKYILTDIEHKKLFFDSKTILQEIVQANFKSSITYRLVGEEGPDHEKSFRVAVYIGEEEYGIGAGHTKKAAEQVAAYQSILRLHKNNIK